MRLWHESLIPKLPRQQLLGQHRECCALRGNGWNKSHSTVNYVFQYSPYKLYQYHTLIMHEMTRRGYHHDAKWDNPSYRGQQAAAYNELVELDITVPIYQEHDENYLAECINNLLGKGIIINQESK